MAERIYSVGIYARLSVEGGSRKNESIETQIEIAKEYMREQGGMILYGCYTDLGRTGTDFERDGFKRLMEDVKQRRVDCVIVKDFSRFGRNYIETGNYIQKIFPFLGVRFVAVTDFFDSLYAQGDDVGVNLKNLANEMYARDISLKVKSAKKAKKGAGGYTGGVPPYGYMTDRALGKRGLSADAGAAEVVKAIFGWYDEGRSLKEIAANLYAGEIHRPTEYRLYHHLNRRPGEELRQWPRTSLKKILTNPVYAGYPESEGGFGGSRELWRQKGLLRPRDLEQEGLLAKEHAHGAIVSQEQFCRIAKRFEERTGEREKTEPAGVKRGRGTCRNQTVSAESEEEGIFSGVLFCGCCGRKLGRRRGLRRSGCGRGGGSCHYFCRNSVRIDGFGCGTGTISEDILTEMVKAILRREAALNNITLAGLAEENKKCAETQKAMIRKRCDLIQKKLRAAEREGSEQYQRYREGVFSREAFLEWKAWKEREGEKARESLGREKRRMQEADAEADRREILLKELDGAFERRLSSVLIERIELYPDKRLKLALRFAGKTGADAAAHAGLDAKEGGGNGP